VLSLTDVRAAAERLKGVAHRTPVLTSRTLDERVGARVHVKGECFQRGGAFKFRGAYNKISSLEADALRSDTNQPIENGKLTVVDNQVDASTGTVKLKAEFPNANLQLWPGQFINVRLKVDTLQHVTVIPTGAVQRGPNGAFVYVVGNDDKATMRPIGILAIHRPCRWGKPNSNASGATSRLKTTGDGRYERPPPRRPAAPPMVPHRPPQTNRLRPSQHPAIPLLLNTRA